MTPPNFFGKGAADRVLLCLAVNGPMLVSELGDTIGIDPASVFVTSKRLQQMGFIAKSKRVRGQTYVALNRAYAGYYELRALLLAIDRTWPTARVKRAQIQRTVPGRQIALRAISRTLNKSVKLRILIFIAIAGNVNLRTIQNALHLRYCSVTTAVHRWERDGVLMSRHRGLLRLVDLEPTFPGYIALQAFLKRMDPSQANRALDRGAYGSRLV